VPSGVAPKEPQDARATPSDIVTACPFAIDSKHR
jgi:hypothetical protein